MHKRASSVKFGVGPTSYLHNNDGTVFCHIELPSGLPKSEVLNTKDSFIDQLHELYLKYIKIGSDQEINISYSQRRQIANAFQNFYDKSNNVQNEKEHVDVASNDQTPTEISNSTSSIAIDCEDKKFEYDMFNIMDSACIEILHLMLHSYKRFILTCQAQRLSIFNV